MRVKWLPCVTWLGALAILLSAVATHAQPQLPVSGLEVPASPSDRRVEVLSHDMDVELHPERHQLRVRDRVTLRVLAPALSSLSFVLNATLHVSQVRLVGHEGKDLSLSSVPNLPIKHETGTQQVTVNFDDALAPDQVLALELQYSGIINDPPREPRHLRFVTPSETAGHIGSEGAYLSGETHWYPDVPGALPTFRVRVITPKTWLAVTHGQQQSQEIHEDKVVGEWEIRSKTEALTLVANRFVKTQQDWQGIEVATYLFPEDAHLAQEYLDASARYLETYTALLGPYPFPKFAVVENFFASGLGMPSFTLLGSGVIKRHYIQPYALGHEIVHSWIGNWVFNRTDHGNWVEGLTTYLANYYYEELTGTSEQAREQRRLMTLGYAIYVRPEEDYSISRFTHKTDQKDNAIGYQKAAMVFHMLRHEIGDEAFWNGLRQLVSEYGGAYADWRDVEYAFSEASRTGLRWFFAQWVERAGAPILAINEAHVEEEREGDKRGYRLQLRVAQPGALYRMTLPVRVETHGGKPIVTWLRLDAAERVVTLSVPARPMTVAIDPDFETFRRLDRRNISPMLNLFMTDMDRSVLVPAHGTDAERQTYQELAKRIMAQDSNNTVSMISDELVRPAGSALVLGGPGVNGAAYWAVSACRDQVSLENGRVAVDGHVYEGANLALLVSCPHPRHPDRVVTLFYGMTPSAAAKVARLLFFYGWHSYLVFQDGTVVARGNFSPTNNSLKVTF